LRAHRHRRLPGHARLRGAGDGGREGTDARSDLYSLGIVFCKTLTGKRPFVGDAPFAALRGSESPTHPQ